MKKIKVLLVFLVTGIIFSIALSAQGPPNPPANQGTSGNQPPAGTTGVPIEPGTGILLLLAGAYGLKKIFEFRKSPAE